MQIMESHVALIEPFSLKSPKSSNDNSVNESGTAPVLLMEIYQHSSFNITKRYLGIEQDERDSVFRDVVI